MSLGGRISGGLAAAAALLALAPATARGGGPGDLLTLSPPREFQAFRRVETLAPTHRVARGTRVRPLPRAQGRFDPTLTLGGRAVTVDAWMRAHQATGLLVLKDGRVLLERYAFGRGPEDRWTSFSMAKSVTSLLVGAAIREGRFSAEDPVERFVPELKGSAYEGVTLRQLLMMSSGVRWNETYLDPASDLRRIAGARTARDEIAYLARLPRAHPPGTHFNYNTAETGLVGIILRRAVGRPLAEYLSEKIWKPYGMERDALWIVDESGQEVAGCCLSATLRDFGRIGQLALDGGRIDGRPLAADGWVEASTRAQIDNGQGGYGYFWWIGRNTFEASGIFGQSILVDPKDRIVIVVNSAWPRPDGEGLFEGLSAFEGALRDAAVGAAGTPGAAR